MNGWREDIARTVSASRTVDDARRGLGNWEDRLADSPQLSALLYESAARAWMAGQLMVRDHELPPATRAFAVEVAGVSFLSQPFEIALRLFLERGYMTQDQATAALDKLRGRSFTATRLTVESVRKSAFDALVTSLKGDGDFAAFAEAVMGEELSLGISPSNHGYLRTVFDTNVVSAYSAGRDRQLTEPAVIEAVPYRIYAAVIDGRVRASHAALDGKAWDARATSAWRRFQGPNDFNCRCMIVSRDAADASALSRAAAHPNSAFDAPPNLEI